MAAQPGTPAHDKAKTLLASYRERGKAAAQAELDAMIAKGMTTFEYVAVTDTFRALLKQEVARELAAEFPPAEA